MQFCRNNKESTPRGRPLAPARGGRAPEGPRRAGGPQSGRRRGVDSFYCGKERNVSRANVIEI
ncbi:MAG: hypothetical protein DBY09_01280 [Selenomonadales bacterium]|nr:MAG: hypothetical protein DBY09_01280 [Selenomonadales bacterium]